MIQYVAAVIAIGSAIYGAISGSKQNKNQRAWNKYNAQMQYNAAQGNIAVQTKLANFNIGMASATAAMQASVAGAQYQMAGMSGEFETMKSIYNADLVNKTVAYNNSLLDASIADMWEAADLDLKLLANQREVERGDIAVHNFQGVVKAKDSYAATMIDSETQQALDAFVIKHGATKKAEELQRTKAKNVYEGNLKAQQILFEGQINRNNLLMGAAANYMGARANAVGTMLQGLSNYAGSVAQIEANKVNAKYGQQSGMLGAAFQYQSNASKIQDQFVSGMLQGVSSAASAYSASNTSGSNVDLFSGGGKIGSTSSGGSYSFSTGYRYNYGSSMSTPGTSLLWSS